MYGWQVKLCDPLAIGPCPSALEMRFMTKRCTNQRSLLLLWHCTVASRAMCYALTGTGGDHVTAVRCQGRPVEHWDNCLPVSDWQGSILCTDSTPAETVLWTQCCRSTEVWSCYMCPCYDVAPAKLPDYAFLVQFGVILQMLHNFTFSARLHIRPKICTVWRYLNFTKTTSYQRCEPFP